MGRGQASGLVGRGARGGSATALAHEYSGAVSGLDESAATSGDGGAGGEQRSELAVANHEDYGSVGRRQVSGDVWRGAHDKSATVLEIDGSAAVSVLEALSSNHLPLLTLYTVSISAAAVTFT